MSKKAIIITVSSIILAIVIICAIVFTASNSNKKMIAFNYFVENKIAESLEEAEKMDMSKPMIVIFHADYCKSCHDFMPIFDKLAKELANEYNFAKLDIQDPSTYHLVAQNVDGLPTLCIFDPSIGNKINIPIRTIRYYSQLKYEVEKYLRIRSFLDMEKAKESHQQRMAEYEKKLKVKKKS